MQHHIWSAYRHPEFVEKLITLKSMVKLGVRKVSIFNELLMWFLILKSKPPNLLHRNKTPGWLWETISCRHAPEWLNKWNGYFLQNFTPPERFKFKQVRNSSSQTKPKPLLVYYPRFHLSASHSSRSTLASEQVDGTRGFFGCTGDNSCLLRSHSPHEGDEMVGGDVRKWSGAG